jgi:hypothetical protein
MKVFISHQQQDSLLAGTIARRLKDGHGIDSYLDLIDPNSSQTGNALGEYLRVQIASCTQLLAVVSSNTKGSWWVPWEIGIATEKDYPLATYAGESTSLPEYLKKWPYLTSSHDLDAYARVSLNAARTLRLRKGITTDSAAQRTATSEFFRDLRAALGQ